MFWHLGWALFRLFSGTWTSILASSQPGPQKSQKQSEEQTPKEPPTLNFLAALKKRNLGPTSKASTWPFQHSKHYVLKGKWQKKSVGPSVKMAFSARFNGKMAIFVNFGAPKKSQKQSEEQTPKAHLKKSQKKPKSKPRKNHRP